MSRNKTRGLGITWKIALLAWLITAVTMLCFIVVIIPEQKRIFFGNLESKANSVAVSIRGVASGAVVNEDYGALVEQCLQILKDDKTIDFLVITKNDGESWIHEQSGWQYARLDGRWHPATRVPGSAIGVVPEFKRRVFHYSQPFDYSGIQWGWIHVGLSLDSYDHGVAAVYRRTGALALLCLLLSLLASVLFAKLLVGPILNLQAAVQRVARGDLSTRAVIHTGDEIELLADSFDAMTGNLRQRDRILGSVQFASQQFLAATDWRSAVGEILTRIGQAAEVSRAYIFENHTDPDGCQQAGERFEYAAPGETRLTDSPKLQNHPWFGTGLEPWTEGLKQGCEFAGLARELSPAEQALLAPSRIQSLILVPILIEGVWRGYLGFDDCTRERIWTDAEAGSLHALADMLGTAVTRKRAQDALLDAKQTLEQRVTKRTEELESLHKELLAASREAGMAEVAVGVLHNVGNVLNSVNVSTALIREKLQRSQVSTLTKLRNLLQQHEPDFAAFLTTDPRGRLVPGFIIKLAGEMEKEQAALKREHELIAQNVEHIKNIVAMQQNYARISGFMEQVSVATIMDHALQMNHAGLARHGVTVVREYSDVPKVTVDKHKILQILVNLVHNAKYALDGAPRRDKQIIVGARLAPAGDQVEVTVADNGIGISPENLTRIFSYGFTTRQHGHGFGLHSGANAAKEMGGRLTVHSEGPGRGATFTLLLPLNPKPASL
jgi:signal transduction histidine kinase